MALVTISVLAALALAGLIAMRFSDGPLGPIRGGPLIAGELIDQPSVDWVAASDGQIETQVRPYFIELELVKSKTSRTTGILLHEGEAYIPCDLGFGWARFSGLNRWILHLIYLVKDWHLRALQDGRVVVRMEGKRYERQAVRVTDPARVEALKRQLESLTAQWQSPKPLGPRPTEGPKDIWFFRLAPR